MPEWLISVLVVGGGIALWALADFLPGPLQARVEGDGVRVRVFGAVPVLHVPFDQIVDIRSKSWSQMFRDGNLRTGSRIGLLRVFAKPVVISRIGRAPVLLAPRNPEAFIREVKHHLALPAA